MGPGWIALIVIVVIVLFLAMYGVGIYNSLVRL
jgi:hypothetical protein